MAEPAELVGHPTPRQAEYGVVVSYLEIYNEKIKGGVRGVLPAGVVTSHWMSARRPAGATPEGAHPRPSRQRGGTPGSQAASANGSVYSPVARPGHLLPLSLGVYIPGLTESVASNFEASALLFTVRVHGWTPLRRRRCKVCSTLGRRRGL